MEKCKTMIAGFMVFFIFLMPAFAQDIHQAAQQGDLERVKALIKENHALLEVRNSENLTPLILSSIHGHKEVVEFLIGKGADIHAGDNEGSNALHNAAAGGHNGIVELLVSKGARVNSKDNNGMTPLHFATSRGHEACVEFLIKKGADVNAEEINERTPLFFAARIGNIDICRLLIHNGASARARNKYGRTPLTYAIWGNHEEIVKLLLDEGTDVNLRDVDGNAPLHQVCTEGQTAIARLLLSGGADTKLKDNTGHTPLHIAANYGQSGIVELLIAQGIDVNLTDSGGDAPIHGAAWSGDLATVELLIGRGAKLNIKNSSGRMPLDYATQGGHQDIIKFLTRKGAKLTNKTEKNMIDVPSISRVSQGQKEPIRMTVLYDNYVATEGTRAEWGFSCLIEGAEKTILFDTGGDDEILAHNIDHLKVDLKKVDQIVISHNHWDHTGGLVSVLEENPNPPVYVPHSFPYDFVRKVEEAHGSVVPIDKPVEICKNVFSTGEMGDRIKEQSLILNTRKGLVVVTGCSHQGIVNILKKAKEILDRDIYLVFGGFHLMQHSDDDVKAIIAEFKKLGVLKCGATHCTGDRQIGLFKEAYGDNYVPIGTGRVLTVE